MSYQSVVLADSPVLYARLGESSGTAATDSSTNANTGTTHGSPTQGVASLLTSDPANTAYTFTGASSQYVNFPKTGYTIADVLTLELWFKTTTAAGTYLISLGWTSGTTGGAAIAISSGQIIFAKTNVSFLFTTAGTYNDGAAHHLVITKNGATSKCYIDNVDVNPTVTNDTMVSVPSLDVTVSCNNNPTPGQFFTGTLDEVAVYTTALSAGQVSAHYAAGIAAAGSGGRNLLLLGVG